MGWFTKRSASSSVGDTANTTIETPDSDTTVPVDADHGPWDSASRDTTHGYIDCGSVKIPRVPGIQLAMVTAGNMMTPIAVSVVVAESRILARAFAAPKNRDLWPELATTIADTAGNEGATVLSRGEGRWGEELVLNIPMTAPNGNTVTQPRRVIGIDGSRWMLRLDIDGRAAIDEEAMGRISGFIDDIVVERGNHAAVPTTLLPLRPPTEPGATTVDETNQVTSES